MSHIIVVFPRRDNAVNIRNVLVRAGMEVSAVCLTGAKVLQYVDNWSDGIVVCGYPSSGYAIYGTKGSTAVFI